jgi:hypothetical protein
MLALAAALSCRVATLLAQTLDAAPPPPTDQAPAAEVVVHGAKLPSRDAASDRMQAQDARAVPGTFGEPLQAVESMPGVVPMVSGLPYFYVRGAPPANTGYFLDGIPLPALFHIGPGPSVVPSPLLDRIDFYPSNAPVQYGRFAGGIIAAETLPPSPVARGEASVRLFDASAFVESPLGDGATSVALGGRYGYPNVLLSVFAPSLSLQYGDYTTRIDHSLGPRDAIALFAIGASDNLVDSSQNLPTVSTQFHRADLRYDHVWAGGGLRVATTFGYDQTADLSPGGAQETATSYSGRLRLEVEHRIGAGARLSAGADVNGVRSTYGPPGGGQVAAMPSQFGGGYVDLRLRPASWVEIAPGIRFDAYRWPRARNTAVDPRLAVRMRASSGFTWVSTFGMADQPPTLIVPVPGYVDASGGLQTTYQISEGVEARLPLELMGRVTAFYNLDRNMSDFVSDCGTFAEACNLVERVDGRTYGVEAFLERPLGERFGGWISYTFSRAERRVGTVEYLSPFDRTHALAAVTRYVIGRGWSAGARFTYYSGRPALPNFANNTATTFSATPGEFPQHRLPDFFRVDLRIDKRWALGGGRWIAAVAEFFDATLAEESVDYRCEARTGHCVAQKIGPIALPSIGVEAGF